MTYNIRLGGRPDRLPAIGRVIRGEAPDVLAVQELGARRRPEALRRLAEATGMRPYLAPSWFGQAVGILIAPAVRVTSAAPIRRPFHHAAVRVSIATDRGELAVIGAHLCPSSARRRRWEAGWIARRVDRSRPVLVMGDLNTLDPWTDHTERVGRLAAAYRSRHLARGRGVDTRAVGVLAGAGLVDLTRHRPDPDGRVRTAPTAHGGGAEFWDMRVDYILGTHPVAETAVACAPRYGGETEHASDHYPVVATFDLELTDRGHASP